MKEVQKYLQAIREANNEIQLANREHRNVVLNASLGELLERGNWRPNIDITQQLIGNEMKRIFRPLANNAHPVQFPQKQRVPNQNNTREYYTRILINEVRNGYHGKLLEDVRVHKLRTGNIEPGTRFYPPDRPVRNLKRRIISNDARIRTSGRRPTTPRYDLPDRRFVKPNGSKQVTLREGQHTVATFDFDGRKGVIQRVEWAGESPPSVDVYYLPKTRD